MSRCTEDGVGDCGKGAGSIGYLMIGRRGAGVVFLLILSIKSCLAKGVFL